MVTKNPHLLLIADLRHASPRWPSLCGALLLEGWKVTVITAPLGPNAAERLGFPSVFGDKATLIEVGPAEDVLEPFRRLLWRVGMQRGQSLSGQLSEAIATRTSRSALRVLSEHAEALLGWPDVYFRWARPASTAALHLLGEHAFTAMVSSSPYPSAHFAAARVKQLRPDMRWVADFRDLWVSNHSEAGVFWRRGIDRWLERRTVAIADAFISPTPEWSQLLGKRYGKQSECVPNGFVDYEPNVETARANAVDGPFTLLYTGVRYHGHQRIEMICDAIKTLKDDGIINQESFRFVVYGPLDAELQHYANALGIADLVRLEPSISRRAARDAQANADALLFYQWDDEEKTNWISSLKLHEYVGTGRQILATGGFPQSSVSNLLLHTERAGLCFTTEQTTSWLRDHIRKWRQRVPPILPPDWALQAKELSGVSRGVPSLKRAVFG